MTVGVRSGQCYGVSCSCYKQIKRYKHEEPNQNQCFQAGSLFFFVGFFVPHQNLFERFSTSLNKAKHSSVCVNHNKRVRCESTLNVIDWKTRESLDTIFSNSSCLWNNKCNCVSIGLFCFISQHCYMYIHILLYSIQQITVYKINNQPHYSVLSCKML